MIEGDHGYPLYRAVSDVKEALSKTGVAPFRFQAGDIDIKADVARADFETWIAPELVQIDNALQQALDGAAASTDQVFLTGGSSLVPAVRRLFTDRFGDARVETGGEFESIASGLSLIGASKDLPYWSKTL